MDKIFLGSAKQREGKFGLFFSLSFSKKDYEEMGKHFNDRGYVNLVMNERKEVGQFGDTHSVSIDNWKPEPKEGGSNIARARSKYPQSNINPEDIPF